MKDAVIVSGGNSKTSKTIALAEALSKELSLWAVYLHLGESIPLLNNELSIEKNFPPVIEFLIQKIRENKTVIFVFPQYNYNFSAFFKNVLDWFSLKSRKIFNNKRVILIGISQTNYGESEFKKITSLTFSALGGEEIIFFNTTPSTSFPELATQLKRYV